MTSPFNTIEIPGLYVGSGTYGCVKDCIVNGVDGTKVVKVINEKDIVISLNECIIMSSLRHPYLNSGSCFVHRLRYQNTPDSPYHKIVIVQTKASGDLTDINITGDKRRIRIIIYKILHVLDFLHRNGIFHCDVKRGNVLYYNGDVTDIKLADFSLSCFKNTNVNGVICGDGYTHPEYYQGSHRHEVDYSVDMWSLGCMIYELYVGKYLYEHDKNVDILLNNIEKSLRKLKGTNDDILNIARDCMSAKHERPTALQLLSKYWRVESLDKHQLLIPQQYKVPSYLLECYNEMSKGSDKRIIDVGRKILSCCVPLFSVFDRNELLSSCVRISQKLINHGRIPHNYPEYQTEIEIYHHLSFCLLSFIIQ